MGTRALVSIYDEDNTEFVTIYHHMDGYPEGLGMQLKTRFGAVQLVNGISPGQTVIANGMDCFAAQVVSFLKGDDVGSVYLHPPGTRDRGEEFHYHLRADGSAIRLEVTGGPTTFFGGSSEHGATSPIWSGLLRDFDPDQANQAYEKAMDSLDESECGPKAR